MESLLTPRQIGKLTEEGRELERYWRDFLPKMYRKKFQEGTLYGTLDRMGTEFTERVNDMVQDGMALDGAHEVIQEEIYSLPPEK